MAFVKLSASYVTVGTPIPFSVYDSQGKLLLVKGHRILSQDQLDRLVDRGVCVLEDELRKALVEHPELALAIPENEIVFTKDKERSLPSVRLGTIRDSTRLMLFSPERFEQQLVTKVESTAKSLMSFVDEDQDRALYLILREETTPHSLYSLAHAMHVAILVHLLTRQLPEFDPFRKAMVCAALTMNISISELQGTLARQEGPPTDEQRALIRSHPYDSCEILKKGGVTDPIWLEIVEKHHEKSDGSGYPKGLTEVPRYAMVVHYFDILLAKFSSRAKRKAVPANKAMKDFFIANRGMNLADAVVKAFGIYPPGTVVKLKNGDAAIVLRRGKTALTPQVLALANAAGEAFPHKILRDTAEEAYGIVSLVALENVMLRLDAESLYHW